MTPTSQFNPLAHLLWYPLSTSTSGTISQMFPTCLVFGVSEEASFKVRGKKMVLKPKPQSLELGTSDTEFRLPWVVSFSLDSCLPCPLPSPAGHKTSSQCYRSTGGPLREGCFLLVNETESVSVLGRNLTFQATKIIRVHLSIIWPRGYNGVCDPWRKTLDSIQL